MKSNTSANAVTTKARSMYGKMLTQTQYSELARKQNLQEIASYLKEHTHYGSTLEDVRGSIIYRRQLELLLRHHVLYQYTKLAPYTYSKNGVYTCILLETEINVILSCLSGIISVEGKNFVADLPTFIQPYVSFNILALANVHTIEQLVKVLAHTPYAQLIQDCVDKNEQPLYGTCEYALRNWYFTTLTSRAGFTHGKARSDLEALINGRAEIINICTIYRLKKFYQITPNEIRKKMLPFHWRLRPRELNHLIAAENDQIFMKLLRESFYGKYVDPDDAFLEEQLERSRQHQERRLLRFSTDSEVIYTAFMLLNNRETQNVVRVIEGVHYGMKPEKIESLLYLI